MKGPVKAVLWGLADPRQALEAGLLGIDGVIVPVAGTSPPPAPHFVNEEVARAIARALPPLAAKLAWLAPGATVPPGFTGVVTDAGAPRPDGALVRIAKVANSAVDPASIAPDVDAVWLPPAPGAPSATRVDFGRVAWLGQHVRTVLEVPNVDDGIETAIRLGRPYAVLFGDAVRFRPGIVDLDRLEDALARVARLNKAAFGGV